MKKKQIALRLRDKSIRLRLTLNLPPITVMGIKEAAKGENKSYSWVCELIINDVFGFPVDYIERKKKK